MSAPSPPTFAWLFTIDARLATLERERAALVAALLTARRLLVTGRHCDVVRLIDTVLDGSAAPRGEAFACEDS
jgi:hypothetical protein